MNPNSPSSGSRIDDVDRHVGKRIRTRRIMLGLSQQTLGSVVDVSVQQIQKYEKAHNRVSCGKLYHFANLLAVPISYFFDHMDSQIDDHDNEKDADTTNTDTNMANEREILLLVRAYNNITDAHVRKKILELARSLTSD